MNWENAPLLVPRSQLPDKELQQHINIKRVSNQRTNIVTLDGEPTVILLVEDNEAHVELMIRSMADLQVAHVIYHVPDGQQALDFLLHKGDYTDPGKSPRPDLVLLDLRIPRVDGLEVLKTIKESPGLKQIPVVVLTSSGAESDITRSYDYHANSYVIKPFGFKTFTTLMGDLGLYWLGLNTPSPRK
jgi:two-component system response regulator